jgi:hypothetical protein
MQKRVTLDHPELVGQVRNTSNNSFAARRNTAGLASRAVTARKNLDIVKNPSVQSDVKPINNPGNLGDVIQRAPVAAKKLINHGHNTQTSAPRKHTLRRKGRLMSDVAFVKTTNRPKAMNVPRESQPEIGATASQDELYQESIFQENANPPKKRFSIRNMMQNANPMFVNGMYVAIVMVFGVGIGVAVDGYISNRSFDQKVAGLSVEDKSNTDGIRTNFVPNEILVNNQQIVSHETDAEYPRYLRIPAIGVGTTRVLEKTMDKKGVIDTPKGIYDTGWYNNGTLPSSKNGAMLLTGQYVGPSQPGVFFHLEHLEKGEIVELEQGDGTIHEFKVVKVVEYDDEMDMDQALSAVNPKTLGLNILSFRGEWEKSSSQYGKRVLVMTEKVDS